MRVGARKWAVRGFEGESLPDPTKTRRPSGSRSCSWRRSCGFRLRRAARSDTLVDADLAHAFTLEGRGGLVPEMTIGLEGESLLDDACNHVSFKKDEVLQPGRALRLYSTVKLN